MRRIALRIAYDGTGHAGWQTQAGGSGIQDQVQAAVAAIAGHPVDVVCAGRTDAGVHALAQITHFDTSVERPLQAWVRGVNACLAQGTQGAGAIVVREAVEVDPAFHARFSAVARGYYYLIHQSPVEHPFWRGRAAWTHRKLDAHRMREAGGMLIGSHDFSAFRSSQCQARSPCRRIDQFDLLALDAMIVVQVRANAFLHHMVRNIVGALVAIGAGSYPPAQMRAWLASRDRSTSPATFAPEGLYFAGALYPQQDRPGSWAVCSGLSPLQELLPGLAPPAA
jgi:tRNA pseudouridine38-40 synthase